MRTTMSRSIPVVLLALAAGACADSQSGEQELLAPETPSAATTAADNQTASVMGSDRAAIVEYDERELFFFHFDARRGLLSAHFPSDRCQGAPLNVGDRQIVTTHSEIQQRLVRATDTDSRVAIYRANSLNDLFADFCGFLEGPTKVAEGVVRHTQTFTNASFAAHWGGTVTGVNGEEMHLSESYQLTASAHDPNNPAFWSLNASQILLSTRGGR